MTPKKVNDVELDTDRMAAVERLAAHLWAKQDSRDWVMMGHYAMQYSVSEQARELADIRLTARRAVDFLGAVEDKNPAMLVELKNQLIHSNVKLETASASRVISCAEAFLKRDGTVKHEGRGY